MMVAALFAAARVSASGARLVLPAASIAWPNGTLSHLDLRVFNTSYISAVEIETVYRRAGCGTCAPPASRFTVGPRQNVALDDAVTSLFGESETPGAIELQYDDTAGPVIVTSRLYASAPATPEYGGFLAVRPSEQAVSRSVFNHVSLRPEIASTIYTAAGGFDPGSVPVRAVYTLFRGDGTALGSVSRTIGPGEFFQFDGALASALGVATPADEDLYLTVAADGPFLPWVVVMDGRCGSLTLLESEEDTAPSDVIPLLVTLSRYRFSPGGPDEPPIRLQTGRTYRITFHAADVEHGISGIPQLGIAARTVSPGADDVVTLTPALSQVGHYNFACTRVCGAGHGGMHGEIEVEASAPVRAAPRPRMIPERIRN